MKKLLAWGVGLCLVFGLLAAETDVYYYQALKDLQITGAEWPKEVGVSTKYWDMVNFFWPRVALKGQGEAFLFFPRDDFLYIHWNSQGRDLLAEIFVAIRSQKGKPAQGTIWLPRPDGKEMARIGFSCPKPNADQEAAARQFQAAREKSYRRLWRMGIPGAAWFRHQTLLDQSGLELRAKSPDNEPLPERFSSAETELQDSVAVFSGGRALSENLQLDRRLRIISDNEKMVPISTLKGITTAEIDWKKEIQGLNPGLDPLSLYIPGDQHAVFFPTFQALLDLLDEIDARGTPVLQLMEPRSEDAKTRERYQAQLCMPMSELSRLFGPMLIDSVAFTGSDPYLRTGTDLAVIFAARDAGILSAAINARQSLAAQNDKAVKKVTGKVESLEYSGVCTHDRSVCSYLMILDQKQVVVSNSLFQLRQIIRAAAGKIPNLKSTGEYTFFRHRYPRGEKKEAALLVLSDATIRRWCGPVWRIQDSRRTRVAAVLSEFQARNLDKMLTMKPSDPEVDLGIPDPLTGDIYLSAKGVRSSVYGTLTFLTPISELPIDSVSASEASAYEWFRDRYQNNWRQFFDPIAIQFRQSPGMLGIDMSIRPLIAHTTYASWIELSRKASLAKTAGDPHPEAMIQFLMGLDPESALVRNVGNFLGSMSPKLTGNGLNWIGDWLTIYVDNDPFWDELQKASDKGGEKALGNFMENNFNRLPLGLAVNIKNGLKLSLFLSALRAFVEQTAPNQTSWENISHNGLSYVKVSERPRPGANRSEPRFAIFYAPTADTLLFTLNESLLKRFLDRSLPSDQAKKTAVSAPSAIREWLGQNLNLVLRDPLIKTVRTLFSDNFQKNLQKSSWGNIPILNEWRKYFKSFSPLEFHQLYWHTRLLCPGGGQYVWNEQDQTMESTIFGHPGRPRCPQTIPDTLSGLSEFSAGVTFEANGLHARTHLKQKN